MSFQISPLRPLVIVAWVCCLLCASFVEAAPVPPAPVTGREISLQPHFFALEDADGKLSASSVFDNPSALVPLDSLRRGSPTGYFWLRATLHADSGLRDPGQILSFSHLTYVDIYLYDGQTCVLFRQAGEFRRRSDIDADDGRMYTHLPLEPGQTYTLLLQVHHTKHFQPVFDFVLQSRKSYFKHLRVQQTIDAALQGAMALFFLYTLLSWIVSRFRPYLWLLLMIAGCGLFVISSSGYFIEWFFPEDPAEGWQFNIPMLHLAMVGLYGLLADFWQLKKYNPLLYRWWWWAAVLVVLSAIVSFTITRFTGNYRLMIVLNLWKAPLVLILITCTVWNCWGRLSSAQRYLAYGLMLVGAAGLFVSLNAALNHEQSLSNATLAVDITIICVFLLFSTGLKEEMRRHEIGKQAALQELTELQQYQKILLERQVDQRTEELHISNKRLIRQKQLLAERNTQIETLINELNHRVKNNLQLLYGLLSLQLPMVKDGHARDILKGNIGKIRAMMLVNQKLFNFEKGQGVCLCEFIGELAAHLQKIYDTNGRTRISQAIPEDLRLSEKHTLSFGLILSELFTNTFKHAFQDQKDPCIRVEAMAVGEKWLQFGYSDNGAGMGGQEMVDRFTMGIPLIKDLTRQMNGQITITKEEGLSYSFLIPV
jgi:two-component sensor histidine kinase